MPAILPATASALKAGKRARSGDTTVHSILASRALSATTSALPEQNLLRSGLPSHIESP